MSREGPSLDRLTHRLSECPPEFLAAPRVRGEAGVHVDAVVHDLVVDLGGEPPAERALAVFVPNMRAEQARLRLVLVAAWLLHDEWFTRKGEFGTAALGWLTEGLAGLARLVGADLFVRDPDRREELARLCLTALGLRPAGETEAQSEDRLRTLDSVERARVIRDTKAKEERARQLRRKMLEKVVLESAAKVSREW